MAMKMGAPVIGLLDCAGLRLQEATDAPGRFWKDVRLSRHGIRRDPADLAVFGNCGGGMAVSAAIADFAFMERTAKLFVNSPNALAGNYASKCDTAAATFQSEEVGLADMAGEKRGFSGQIRTLVSILPANNEEDCPMTSVKMT